LDFTADLAKVFDHTNSQMVSLGLSSDGFRLLYVCPHEFLITDTNRGEIVFRHSDPTANFCKSACSPTGNRAAVGCSNSGSVTVFNWSGQTVCSINHGSRPEGIAFSPDGSLVAIVGAQKLQLCRSDNSQEIFEQSLSHPGSSVGFSHTGAQLAYGERFGPVVVVEVATRQPLRELRCGSDTHCLAFSPDDSLLATGHGDSIIRIWDVQTGRSRAELMGHECAVHDVIFAPDGHTLLSSADDGAVRLWSVDHGRGYGVIHQRFEPGSNEAKCRLSLSSGGGRLAIGYRTQQQGYPDVLLWKTAPTISK
jgi:WD40 repeat protein